MKRVLVLDASQRSALAVTRSLGKQGVFVLTADESTTALAGCSHYSKQYLHYPSPRLHTDEFVAAIILLCERHDINIVLPMTELTTALLLKNKSSLSAITLPWPDLESVDLLADKSALMRLAESLGIPTPRTWYADNPASLPCNLDELPYPLVLKPGKSWLNVHNVWIRSSVRVADSPEDALHILESDPAFRQQPFVLQEYISGHGQGIFALYDHGKPLAFFAHRRLREKPPSGGVSVLSESIPVDPVLRSHARSLLDRVGWHGIAMVEFKVSDRGMPYLMEVNTRFWGSLQLAIDAGIDFPWLLYRLACGEQANTDAHYRTGIRLRWLLGDLDSLYLTLRDRKSYNRGEKIKSVIQFITPSFFRTRHEVFRWDDPGPFWCEMKRYCRDLID
jgi:predicted ATP-grasp superfamily ATP-dependent carboligase